MNQYKYTYKTLQAMHTTRLIQWIDNNNRVKRSYAARQLRECGFTFGDLFKSILNK